MRTRLVIAACAFALATACSWQKSLQQDLQPYQGRNIKALVARLGYPDSQDTLLGRRVYVWSLKAGTYATCKITVATDPSDTITDFSFIGDRRSCNVYDEKLGE